MLGAAAAAPFYVNCGSGEEEEAFSEDDIVNNKIGLGLRYDEATSLVSATVAPMYALKEGETLKIRVLQGKIKTNTEKNFRCSELSSVTPIKNTDTSGTTADGRPIYKGPKVEKRIVDLLHLYDDERWQTGGVPPTAAQIARDGSDPIVQACVLDKAGKTRGKIVTNLAYAWDQNRNDNNGGNNNGGSGGARPRINEGARLESQIEYGKLCVQELGEIPFFPPVAGSQPKDYNYETFDCRDLDASKGDSARQKIPGVEGAMVPSYRDGQLVTKCDPGSELGPESSSYDCLNNTEAGMFLDRGGVQPGPMVVTAKNKEGTHWLLLCRKIADDGNGMTKSKKFNDMAMIGHNPKTGKTCFFQNSINSGTDGAHVPHPADIRKSTTVWSSSMQTYCSGNCHSADPFVHSPWIDGALRSNGKPIVPKMGDHPDFVISQNDNPYYIVNMKAEGFTIPKQLISEDALPCATCHRLAGSSMLGDFTRWSTGTGDEYMSQRSATGKKFEKSHWMPMRLDGLNEQNWAASKWGKAVDLITKCASNSSDAACEWENVPHGNNLNPY